MAKSTLTSVLHAFIHKTARRYHFLLRFIDLIRMFRLSLFLYLFVSLSLSLLHFLYRPFYHSSLPAVFSRVFPVSFIIDDDWLYPLFRSRPVFVHADKPNDRSTRGRTRGNPSTTWLACFAVVLSRDCVLKQLDVLDAAMSIANLLTRIWLTTFLISRPPSTSALFRELDKYFGRMCFYAVIILLNHEYLWVSSKFENNSYNNYNLFL